MNYKHYKPGLDLLEAAITHADDLDELDRFRGQLKRAYDSENHSNLDRIFSGLNKISRNISNQDFESFCESNKNSWIIDLGDPAKFDLDAYEQCREILLRTKGLIGISVTVTPECARNFPKYLQQRLHAMLTECSDIEPYAPEQVSLKASIAEISAIVNQLMPYRTRLKVSDILLPVIVDDEDRLSRFWQCLSTLNVTSTTYCFLVLIIKESNFSSPQDIQDLPPPEFTRAHIISWVNALVKDRSEDRGAKQKLILQWADWIAQGSSASDQQLLPDRVYEHIVMSLEWVKQQSSIEDLFTKFKQENLYG